MASDGAVEPAGRRRREDRWAHRRGEPRVFALLWTIFLLCASLLTVLQGAGGAGLDAATARAPARALLVVIGVGVGILWPTVRLSQASPRRPVRAALLDVVVIVLPMQAVLWPSTLLGRWSPGVTFGVSVAMASWALLVGSALAIACRTGPGPGRTVWMVALLGLSLAAPAARLGGRAFGGDRADGPPLELMILSPVTAGWAITESMSGGTPRMTRPEWAALAAPALASCPLWVIGAARSGRRSGGGRAT